MSQVHTHWTQQELDIVRRRLADGWTPAQIAPELPQRTVEAIKTKARLVAGNTGKYFAPVRPMNPVRVRLDTLIATTAAAASERTPDVALVEQYRRGVLQMLAVVHGVKTRGGSASSLLSHSVTSGDSLRGMKG